MKVDLMEPAGDLTPDLVADALLLLDSSNHLSAAQLAPLTPIELQLVYDWAMREMLAASDNRVRRRPRPHALTLLADDGEPSDFDQPEVQSALRAQDQRVIGDQAKVISELIVQVSDLKARLEQTTSELEEAQAQVVDLETVH